jgi:hypothetical protein
MLTVTLFLTLLVGDPASTDLRTKLTVGELFVPKGLEVADGPIDLVVHLHGSAELMERNLTQAGNRAVLVTVSLNGLSSVYTRQFANPETFLGLVNEAAQKTSSHLPGENVSFRRVVVSSFSAGFGGVRELLKSEECYRRIDSIVMADSIYAGYVDDSRERGVDPKLMAGFLRFARDAVGGKKQLVISHCQLQPDGYASTAETADFLVRELGLTRRAVQESWSDRWECESRCEQSGLRILGFRGATGADHMQHLRNIGRLWKFLGM